MEEFNSETFHVISDFNTVFWLVGAEHQPVQTEKR